MILFVTCNIICDINNKCIINSQICLLITILMSLAIILNSQKGMSKLRHCEHQDNIKILYNLMSF